MRERMRSTRNVVYYNAHKDVLARTLISAHHSFGFFARRGASMTTVIEIYEIQDKKTDERIQPQVYRR